jgi:hypothetical protein
MAQFATVSRAQQSPALVDLDTTMLENLLKSASDLIENYCDRSFDTGVYTEVQDGVGLRWLYLPNTPISSVTSATITEEDESTSTVDPSGIIVDSSSGKIEIAPWSDSGYGSWPIGSQNITIVYGGGYATIPEPIQEATVQVAANLYGATSAKNMGMKSEKLGDYSYTRMDGAMNMAITPMVGALLANYKRMDFYE